MSNEEITYEQVVEYCKKRNLDLIDHAFLIRLYNNRKSIPIEWIEKYKRVRGWEVTVTTQNAIDNMLNAWEKENENMV